MKNKKTGMMGFDEFRATLNEDTSKVKDKQRGFTEIELQTLVDEILSIKEIKGILYKEFKKTFLQEHENIQNSIIENEDILVKQELAIKNNAEKIQTQKDDIERTKVMEAYISRNSLKSKTTKENQSQNGKIKPLSKREENELKNTNIDNQLIGVEELAVKQYIKSPRLIEYIKLEVSRGATLIESLQNNRVDLYTQNLITRGVETLLKGNELVKYDSSHLF